MSSGGIQAADALDYAHQQGVIHRDIKPSNLIIDTDGRLWVTDFGLAHIETGATLTLSGDIVGTLRYMSPEQAAGKRSVVDHRADIYSLGATLYELLTLRPPFAGDDRKVMLGQVLSEQPPAPRSIDPAIPIDLETIVLTAMAKESQERYGSAGELAADLRRFLEHKPIRARRPGAIERAAKWIRRHQGLTATILAVAGLICVLVVSGLVLLSANNQKLRSLSGELLQTNRDLQSALAAAEAARTTAEHHRERADETAYALTVRQAYRAYTTNDVSQAAALLKRLETPTDERQYDRREFAAHHLQHLIRSSSQGQKLSEQPLYASALSPDETRLAVAGQSGEIWIVDAATYEVILTISSGQIEVNDLSFSPDGGTLASAGDDGSLKLWNTASGEETGQVVVTEGQLYCASFIPQSRCIAAAGKDGSVHIIDRHTLEEQAVLRSGLGSVGEIDVSRDGTQLVAINRAMSITLWNLSSGRRVRVFEARNNRPTSVAFSPDGSLIATGHVDGQVYVWRSSQPDPQLAGEHLDDLRSVRFNADGSQIIASDRSGAVHIWATPVDGESEHSEPEWMQIELWRTDDLDVSGIWCGLTPDGNSAMLLLDDRLLVRDISTGEVTATMRPARDEEWPVQLSYRRPMAAFSSDGRYLVCRSELYCRDDAESLDWRFVTRLEGDPQQMAGSGFLNDENILIMVQTDGSINALDLQSLKTVPWKRSELPEMGGDQGNDVQKFVLSPDARNMAWVTSSPAVHIMHVDPADMEEVVTCHPIATGRVVGLSFSGDGQVLATLTENATHIQVWDCSTGKQICDIPCHPLLTPEWGMNKMQLSPDGQACLCDVGHQESVLWDLKNNSELWRFDHHGDEFHFSFDGSRLLLGNLLGRAIRVWEKASRFKTRPRHPGGDVAKSPLLPTDHNNGPMTWQAHDGSAYNLIILPSTNVVISVGADGWLRTWDPSARLARYVLTELFEGGQNRWKLDLTYDLLAVSGAYRYDFFNVSGDEVVWEWATGGSLNGSVAIDPTGEYIAISRGDDFAVLHQVSHEELWNQDYTLSDRRPPLRNISYASDGQTLAVVLGQTEDSVHFYDMARRQRLAGPKIDGCSSIACSPDGRQWAASSLNDVVLFRLNDDNGEVARLCGHTNAVNIVAFSPDAKLIATGANDRRIMIWDALTCRRLTILQGHIGSISDLSFSPDGRTLASAGGEDGVWLWHLPSQLPLCHLLEEPHFCVRFDPSGKRLFCIARNGTVTVLEGQNSIPPQQR